jgi:WD40 repeat protein
MTNNPSSTINLKIKMKSMQISDNSNSETLSSFTTCPIKKKYALTILNSDTMSLYDYDDQEPTRLSHSGTLMSSIFSTDGNFLASGSDDGSIKIWKLSENQSSEKNLIIQDS